MLLHHAHKLAHITLIIAADICAKTHGFSIGALFYYLVKPIKGAAADKEDVGGIHLYKLLVGMLAPALGRNICNRTLQQLQHRLLYALAGNITGNGGVLAFSCNFINFIDVDYAFFGALHVKVSRLQKLQQNVLNILTHITRLSESGCIGNCKGHIKHLCHGLGEKGLAAAGGADEQDIALLQLYFVFTAVENSLIMIIYSNGKDFFCLVLPDNILVKIGFYLHGFGELLKIKGKLFILQLFLHGIGSNNAGAHIHAFLTDIAVIPRYQAVEHILGFAAKRAP